MKKIRIRRSPLADMSRAEADALRRWYAYIGAKGGAASKGKRKTDPLEALWTRQIQDSK
jgi:hypothetical protein